MRALTFATSAAKVHPEQDVHASTYIKVMGRLNRVESSGIHLIYQVYSCI